MNPCSGVPPGRAQFHSCNGDEETSTGKGAPGKQAPANGETATKKSAAKRASGKQAPTKKATAAKNAPIKQASAKKATAAKGASGKQASARGASAAKGEQGLCHPCGRLGRGRGKGGPKCKSCNVEDSAATPLFYGRCPDCRADHGITLVPVLQERSGNVVHK
jgi:hypothetical protein